MVPTGWWDDDAWFRTKIDVLVLNGPMAVVADWKTGKHRPDFFQMELFAIQVFKHYPDIETVRGGLVFVVCNELVKEQYDYEVAPSLWAKWLADYNRMEQAYIKDVWNANQSGLCKRHCVVTECVYNGRN